MTNTGTVAGIGRVSNKFVNAGILRAEGGQLTLSAADIFNSSNGQVQAATGNTVFFTQGLTNAGTVQSSGDTWMLYFSPAHSLS